MTSPTARMSAGIKKKQPIVRKKVFINKASGKDTKGYAKLPTCSGLLPSTVKRGACAWCHANGVLTKPKNAKSAGGSRVRANR